MERIMNSMNLNETEIEMQLEKLEQRAIALEKSALETRLEQRRLQRALNELRNQVNPFCRLPPELQALIFERCVDADTKGHVLTIRALPWTLAQTCRRWREIALSTPTLWSLFRINSGTGLVHHDPVQMAKTWLERSNPLPISCLVILNHIPLLQGLEDTLFKLIIAQSSRWRHLDIDLKDRQDLFEQLFSIEHPLPFLRSIRVYVTLENPNAHLPVAALSSNAPDLRDAHIYATSPYALPISLPWSQLRNLEVTFSASQDLFTVSETMHSLESCVIEVGQLNPNLQYSLAFPTLRRFEISGPIHGIITVLDSLQVPTLKDLHVIPAYGSTLYHQHADELLSSITNFHSRCSSRLEKLATPLTLWGSPNSPRLAEALSTIAELHIRLETEEGSQQAVQNLRDPQMLPNLKALHLLVHKSALPLSLFSEFVDMVEARRYSERTQQLVCLSIDTVKYVGRPKIYLPASDPPFQRLLKLEREGLVLMGSVTEEGMWRPLYTSTNAWNAEKEELRWSRFGYSEYLDD
ncbi:hypothetical protein PQX77_011884 [Marasmius sp. AFHP31]|nr:hypothetical protein PQX77_011884 [Marasmius sp. AFHP31]